MLCLTHGGQQVRLPGHDRRRKNRALRAHSQRRHRKDGHGAARPRGDSGPGPGYRGSGSHGSGGRLRRRRPNDLQRRLGAQYLEGVRQQVRLCLQPDQHRHRGERPHPDQHGGSRPAERRRRGFGAGDDRLAARNPHARERSHRRRPLRTLGISGAGDDLPDRRAACPAGSRGGAAGGTGGSGALEPTSSRHQTLAMSKPSGCWWRACPVPLVVAGGRRKETAREALEMVAEAMACGAGSPSGATYGRAETPRE